jgi:predicted site-specific integrase-resolvase
MSRALTLGADDELLGIGEVAREAGVSRAAAYTWALSGRIPARNVAGRLIVRRRDLDAARARGDLIPRRRGTASPRVLDGTAA